MARYYFDLYSGEGLVPDEEGQELPCARNVWEEAVRALPEIARDEVLEGASGCLAIRVRDETGRSICEVTLKLDARWLC